MSERNLLIQVTDIAFYARGTAVPMPCCARNATVTWCYVPALMDNLGVVASPNYRKTRSVIRGN
jgi:hypothetical protein